MMPSNEMGWLRLAAEQHKQHPPVYLPLAGAVGAGTPARYFQQAAEPEGDALGRLLQVIRKRWVLLCSVPLIGAAAGYLVSLPMPPAYRAKASVEIQALNENFLNVKDIEPTTNSTTSEGAYLQTQVKILESRAVRQRVVDRLNLAKQRDFYAPRSAWSRMRGKPGREVPARDANEMALGAMWRQVKVQPSAETRVIEVTADAGSGQLAADLANCLVDEYVKYTMEARWGAAQRIVAFLTPKLEELRKKIDAGHYELAAYLRATGLLLTQDNTSVAEERLRRMQDELSRAQAERIAKQSQQGVLDVNHPEAYPRAMEESALKNYQLTIADLRRQLAELLSSYTPEHYKVQRVQAQIQEMEKALNRERANLVARVSNDFSAAQTRERMLATDYSRQEQIVLDQSQRMIRYASMLRELKANEELYDSMAQKIRAAGMGSTVTASNIRPLDTATVPGQPSSPQPLLNALLGLTGSLFFAVAIAFFREYSDRSVHSPVDLVSSLDIPQLGVVPSAADSLSDAKALSVIEAGRGGSDPLALVTWSQKPSLMAQSFRSALASILFSRQGPPPRVIVVTSPNPGEGKSTVVSNLAIALAEVKVKTLLIDGDMLGPRLHEIFRVENDSGLADLLSLQGTQPDSFVRETMVPGLSLITAGLPGDGGPALLYSPWFRQLIESLAESYDAILIDSPPMLHVADARIMGRSSDGVVLVLRAGVTDRQNVLAAAQRLTEDGTPVIGTVLNDFKAARGGPHGYGYSYRQQAKRRMA